MKCQTGWCFVFWLGVPGVHALRVVLCLSVKGEVICLGYDKFFFQRTFKGRRRFGVRPI